MDLITRSLKIDEITSEAVGKLIAKAIEEYSLKKEDVEYVLKGIATPETKVDETERSVVSYINTAARDRDNEIIVPKGAVLKDYKKNPVVMWAHNYSVLPLGKNIWIKNDNKGLVAKTQYAKHPKAEEVYQYRKGGFPLAESIGFIPLKVIYPEDVLDEDLEKLGLDPEEARKARRIYVKWILLEYSDVPVPCNPEALELAVSKGLISKEDSKEYEVGIEIEDLGLKIYCADGKGGSIEVTREDVGDSLFSRLVSENPPGQNDLEVKEFLQKLAGGCDCDLGKEYEIDKDIEFGEDEYIDKSLVEKPYKDEHSCRLLEPGDFDRFARKNCFIKHDKKCIDCIFGIKENKAKLQAMRYKKKIWIAADAKKHCKSKNGTFEAAKDFEPTALGIETLDNTKKLFDFLKLDGGVAIAYKDLEPTDVIEAFSGFLLEKLTEKDTVIEFEKTPEPEGEIEEIGEIEIEGSSDPSGDQIKNIIGEAMTELVSKNKLNISDLVGETVRKLQGKIE